MKKTVILAKNLRFDFDSVFTLTGDELYNPRLPSDYVQISEPVEVDFLLLPEKDLTDKRVEIIDKEISEVRASLHQLEQQKQELLSLPAPE